MKGGANLGTRRCGIPDVGLVAAALERHQINNVVIAGGWDGYAACAHIEKHKSNYPYLKKVCFVLIPISISNNLPCSDISIGSDTALNNIIECCDKIKQSAVSSSKVFVVEVMGTSGYLVCLIVHRLLSS